MMSLIGRIVMYLILGIPLLIFLISFFVCFKRKHKPSGWQYASTAALVIILFLYCWIDTGLISRFIVKVGGQDYYISPNALEEVISKNIDNLGLAIGKVYEKYYIIEIFDCSKESDTVIFCEDKGMPTIKLKLKHLPIENTLECRLGGGFYSEPSKDNDKNYDSGFYFLRFLRIKGIDELKKVAQGENLFAEIKYFRK